MAHDKQIPHILLVDDDDYFRQMLVQVLEPLGFPILEAASASDAAELLDYNLVLAIVDFRMPETDGATFISRLREGGHRMPIVFVSAIWCDQGTFNWLRNILRVSLVLQKPIDPHLFFDQIDALLPAQRPLLHEPEFAPDFNTGEYESLMMESVGDRDFSPPPLSTPLKSAAQQRAKPSTPTSATTPPPLSAPVEGSITPPSSDALINIEVKEDDGDTAEFPAYADDAPPPRARDVKPYVTPAGGTPKPTKPRPDAVTEDTPKPGSASKAEASKAEALKADAPKADAPKADAPKAEAQKAEAPTDPSAPKSAAMTDPEAIRQKFQAEDTGEIEGESHEAELLRQLRQLRQKLQVEAQIKKVQAELRKDFPAEWAKFTTCIKDFHASPSDGELRNKAIAFAHKMRGSAGSLGLGRASACATKMEDLLRQVDAADSADREECWTQILRALSDGEASLTMLDDSDGGEHRFSVGKILVVANEETLKDLINRFSPYAFVDWTVTDTVLQAMIKASSMRFDGVLIDAVATGKDTALSLAKEIRMTAGNDAIPLLFVVSPSDPIDAVDLMLAGVTAQLQVPFDDKQFEDAVRKLGDANRLKYPRVLTVDDDHVLTRFISTVLAGQGLHVSVLNEPIKILQTLDEVEPDLLLLDVVMPGLSGYDLCRRLREIEKWNTLPVIFLTSKSDAQGRAAAFQAGGNDFLSKPILSEELISRVKTQMQRTQLQREQITCDELSGVLKQDIFLRRSKDAFAEAQENKRSALLCLFTVDGFSELTRHGVFAGFTVITMIGKLLRARFKSDALRGRYEDGFALMITGEDKQVIEDALQYFANDIEDANFTGVSGGKFDVRITMATASYPGDGKDFDELLATARAKHQSVTTSKAGALRA